MASPVPPVLRFGEFELDRGAYELRRHGRRVKIGRQPMDLLILLVERPRQLVPRSEIAERLWGPDVFVDIETGVNTAISKVRQALRDDADRPVYVETVAGKGYRFIAPIDTPTKVRQVEPPAGAAGRESALGAAAAVGKRYWPAAVAVIVILAAVLALAAQWRSPDGAQASRTTIAVLPFANAQEDQEQAYLALGLTDETIASIAQIDPSRLILKGRTGRYKGTTKSVAEIGQELGVDYLLDGTVRTEGGRLRVTATLIRVRDEEHVWSQAYEREVTSALALQQDLSAAIAGQIRTRLSPDAAGVVINRQTAVPAAYDAYLRGRFLLGRRAPEANRQGVEALRRAIALDPNYALAWSSLALLHAGSSFNADTRPGDVAPAARDAATRALRANPDLADAQQAAAMVSWAFDWDWPQAERQFRRAIALDPGAAGAYLTLGHLLSQMGRAREAEAAMARASDLEPLDPIYQALWSQVSFQGRDSDGALRHARQAILADSTFWIGHMMLAQGYAQSGQADLAVEALADAIRLSGGNSKATSLRGYLLARTGRVADAHAVLRLLEAQAKERYVPPYAFALVHAGLGDATSTFEWLDKAYAERDVHLIYLTVDDKWDPYRADPRFQALLTRCGFTAPASRPVPSP